MDIQKHALGRGCMPRSVRTTRTIFERPDGVNGWYLARPDMKMRVKKTPRRKATDTASSSSSDSIAVFFSF